MSALRDGLRSIPTSDGAGEDDEDNNTDGGDIDDDGTPQRHRRQHGGDETRTFRDERTMHLFGGPVSVTMTFGTPSEDDDDDNDDGPGRRSNKFYAREEQGPGHVHEAVELSRREVNLLLTTLKGMSSSSS